MEPLTAFFILEGLVFAVIGTIVISKGLYPIKPQNLKSVKEIQEDFSKKNRDISDLYIRIRSIPPDEKHDDEIRNLYDLIDIRKKERDQLGKAIPTQIRALQSTYQFERGLDYTVKGLPCLLGGFLLQGIGVITQLH